MPDALVPALTAQAVVAAAPGQASCDLGGEAVILGLADDTYYGLNEVGAFVWARLAEPGPVWALRDAVTAAFDVAPEVAERDLLALLDEMVRRGLVQVMDGAAGG